MWVIPWFTRFIHPFPVVGLGISGCHHSPHHFLPTVFSFPRGLHLRGDSHFMSIRDAWEREVFIVFGGNCAGRKWWYPQQPPLKGAKRFFVRKRHTRKHTNIQETVFTIFSWGGNSVIFEQRNFVAQVYEDAMRIAHFQKCVSHESGACVYSR